MRNHNISFGSPIVVCHSGLASNPSHFDGPRAACIAGLDALESKSCALEAIVAATQSLEADERFNAATGSNLRLDGVTMQMDTPHVLLVAAGATEFARRCGVC